MSIYEVLNNTPKSKDGISWAEWYNKLYKELTNLDDNSVSYKYILNTVKEKILMLIDDHTIPLGPFVDFINALYRTSENEYPMINVLIHYFLDDIDILSKYSRRISYTSTGYGLLKSNKLLDNNDQLYNKLDGLFNKDYKYYKNFDTYRELLNYYNLYSREQVYFVFDGIFCFLDFKQRIKRIFVGIRRRGIYDEIREMKTKYKPKYKILRRDLYKFYEEAVDVYGELINKKLSPGLKSFKSKYIIRKINDLLKNFVLKVFSIFKSKKQKLKIKIIECSKKLLKKMAVNNLYSSYLHSSIVFKELYNEKILHFINILDIKELKMLLVLLNSIFPLCLPIHEQLIIDKLNDIDKLFKGIYKIPTNFKEIDSTKINISTLQNEIKELENESKQISLKKENAVKENDKIIFGICLRELQKIDAEILFKTKSLDALYKTLIILLSKEYLQDNASLLEQAEANAEIANNDEIKELVEKSSEINVSIESDFMKTKNFLENQSFENDIDAEWKKEKEKMLNQEVVENNELTSKVNN